MKYTCHEDGVEFDELEALQRHLKSKTAWSNSSLVGCRVSVLLENREWSEGLVSQYHRSSGKHCVEFRHSGARRWLVMLRTAFYIVDRTNGGGGGASSSSSSSSAAPPSLSQSSSSSSGSSSLAAAAAAAGTTTTTTTTQAASLVVAQKPLASSSTSAGGPGTTLASEETKEEDLSGQRGEQEPWTFAEDLSLFYAKAQSTMHSCYGCRIQETGHKTLGHTCVTEEDKRAACESHGSLLYGELLPRGVNKALDERHLDARRATVLFDLGMGTGKVAMQAFLQFPNLKRVFGVELSAARYRLAEDALLNLARDSSHEPQVKLQHRGPDATTLVKTSTKQTLEIVKGNLFHTEDVETADVIMLETEIPSDAFAQFSALLDAAKDGARILTYLDLRKVWQLPGRPFPFRQLESNRSFADRYATSWSVHRGHHLFLWVKVLKPSSASHLDLNLNKLQDEGNNAGRSADDLSWGTTTKKQQAFHSSSGDKATSSSEKGASSSRDNKATSSSSKSSHAAFAKKQQQPGGGGATPQPSSSSTTPRGDSRRQPYYAPPASSSNAEYARRDAAAAAGKQRRQRPSFTEEVACQPKWPALVSRGSAPPAASSKKYGSHSRGGSCVVS